MIATRVQGSGTPIDYTPDVDVDAGTIVILGGQPVGVVPVAIPANQMGAVEVDGGVWDVTKGSEDFAAGDEVFLAIDANTAEPTSGDGGRVYFGPCVQDAASGDATVRCLLVHKTP